MRAIIPVGSRWTIRLLPKSESLTFLQIFLVRLYQFFQFSGCIKNLSVRLEYIEHLLVFLLCLLLLPFMAQIVLALSSISKNSLARYDSLLLITTSWVSRCTNNRNPEQRNLLNSKITLTLLDNFTGTFCFQLNICREVNVLRFFMHLFVHFF